MWRDKAGFAWKQESEGHCRREQHYGSQILKSTKKGGISFFLNGYVCWDVDS